MHIVSYNLRKPVSNTGTTCCKYVKNITGYTALSVTPLNHFQKPS